MPLSHAGRSRLRRLAALLPPLALMAAIVALSSVPHAAQRDVHHADKLFHAAEFALLGFLAARGLALGLGFVRSAAPAAALLATLFGVTDELHQRRVAGRRPSAADAIADAAGASLGAWTWARRERRRRSSPKVDESGAPAARSP